MTTFLNLARSHRDPITALFAAALEGDVHAESRLRDLAVHDDRAADALCALASIVTPDPGSPSAADIAATDQMIAAVLEAVTVPAPQPESAFRQMVRGDGSGGGQLLKAGRPRGLRP